MTNYIGSLARPIGRSSAAMPQVLGQVYAQLQNWRRRRRDELALQNQPDYLLKDIGLERHEVERALRGRHDW